MDMDKWTNVCRSCLVKGESFSYFIYENVSPEIYSFCTSIEVKQDELPKSLCTWCYDLLTQFAQFKKTCIQSENKLHGYFNSLKLENEARVDYVEIEIKNEKIDDNLEITAVVTRETNSDDDPSDADFHNNINSQEQQETVLKEEASTENENDLESAKRKRPVKYTCELCNRKFKLKKRFETHKLAHSAPIQCKVCSKTFNTWNCLYKHNRREHSSRRFENLTCKVCSRDCKTPFTLKMHEQTHAERKILCDECGKKFKNKAGLKSHLQTHIHNRQRSIPCPHCGNKYLTKTSLAKHLSRRHTDRRFICHYCDYQFSDKGVLIKHLMIHEGTQRLYKCDVCFRTLTALASLVVHKRIHTGERPFACSTCPKKFITKRMLIVHERSHTGEKPFKCALCELSFSQSSSRKRHMKVHDRRT